MLVEQIRPHGQGLAEHAEFHVQRIELHGDVESRWFEIVGRLQIVLGFSVPVFLLASRLASVAMVGLGQLLSSEESIKSRNVAGRITGPDPQREILFAQNGGNVVGSVGFLRQLECFVECLCVVLVFVLVPFLPSRLIHIVIDHAQGRVHLRSRRRILGDGPQLSNCLTVLSSGMSSQGVSVSLSHFVGPEILQPKESSSTLRRSG